MDFNPFITKKKKNELHQFKAWYWRRMSWAKLMKVGTVCAVWDSILGSSRMPWGFVGDPHHLSLSHECHTKTVSLSAWISNLILNREEKWEVVSSWVLVLEFTWLLHFLWASRLHLLNGNSPNYIAGGYSVSWNRVLCNFPCLRQLQNLLKVSVLEWASQRRGEEIHKVWQFWWMNNWHIRGRFSRSLRNR